MGLIWKKLVRPAAFKLDAEYAHELAIKALRGGLASPFYAAGTEFHFGPIDRFGLKFPNPIGVAAGFDKNGIVYDQLSSLGFGFVEVGTVTLRPQNGNEKPRMFRLPDDRALINRLGFNNDGAEAVAQRLRNKNRKCVVGVNIGRNKDVPNEEAVENYLACFEIVHPVADYIAVNVSSPNTPDLRDLQKRDNLDVLLSTLQSRNRRRGAKPLLVKIAPDLSDSEVEKVVEILVRHEIAGVIATNTTIARDGLETKNVESFGGGGLSGKPLAGRSNEIIAKIFRTTNGKLPIIGVGGIFSAEDAFEKIAAGASLLQAYTGFIYSGPSFAREISVGLAAILKSKGFSTLQEAVGINAP
jgi:dihydroorotate dehydrogenase